MTAVDEGNGASTTLTVSVSAAPFELSEFVASYGLILLIIVILALVGAVMVLSNRRSSSVRSESQFDQTSSLKRVSMDDAFDDPEYDPFDLKSRKDGPKKKALETVEDSVLETDELEKSEDSQTPEDTSEEEDNDFPEEEELEIQDQDHLTDIGETEEDSEEITAPLEAVLSEEDIEALFEE